MVWLKSLQKPQYWLLSVAVALVTLHLTILEQAHESNLMGLSFLLWLAIASLIWDKRKDLPLDSGVFSSALGASLIALVLLRSLSPAGYHPSLSPFISGLGLCLMASGAKRLPLYWKELSILGLLVCYPLLTSILEAINLPLLTSKFSAFSLWAAGFNAYRQGVFIILPTGRVEVYGSCSGVESILLMLYAAILFLLMIPLRRLQQFICLAVAVLLGFIVNGMRVALMAILVASSNKSAFTYWHGGDGSLIFAIISMVLFGTFCWFAYVRNLNLTSDAGES